MIFPNQGKESIGRRSEKQKGSVQAHVYEGAVDLYPMPLTEPYTLVIKGSTRFNYGAERHRATQARQRRKKFGKRKPYIREKEPELAREKRGKAYE